MTAYLIILAALLVISIIAEIRDKRRSGWDETVAAEAERVALMRATCE